MVDVTAKLLSLKINIYDLSQKKITHKTEAYGREILVNYIYSRDFGHFTAGSVSELSRILSIEKQEHSFPVDVVELQDNPIDRLASYPAQPSATNSQQERAIPHTSQSDNRVNRQAPQPEKDSQSANSANLQADNEANQPIISSNIVQVSAQENLQQASSFEQKLRDRKTSVNNRELLIAAGEGNVERIKSLIDEGVDVNFKDKDGDTALHYAVEGDNLEIVKLLIKNGADVDLCNNGEENPLALSIQLNRKNIIQILSLSKHLKTVKEQDYEARKIFSIEENSEKEGYKNLLPISDRHYLILNGAIGEKLPSDGQKQDTSQKNTEVKFSKLVNSLVGIIISKFDELLEKRKKFSKGKNFLFYLIKKPKNKLKVLVAISGFGQSGKQGYSVEHKKLQNILGESLNDAKNNDDLSKYKIEGIFVPFSRKEEKAIIKDNDLFDPIKKAFKNFEQFEQNGFTNKMSLMAKILQGDFLITGHAINTILKNSKNWPVLIGDFNEVYRIKNKHKNDLEEIGRIELITMTLLKEIEEKKRLRENKKSVKWTPIEKNIAFLKDQSKRLYDEEIENKIDYSIYNKKIEVIDKYRESLEKVWKQSNNVEEDIDIFSLIQYQARCSEDNLIDYLSYNSDVLKEKGTHYIFSIEKGAEKEKSIPIRPPCSFCILHFPLEFSIIASSKAGLPIFDFKNRLEIPKSVDILSIKEKLSYLSENAQECDLENIFQNEFTLSKENYEIYLKNAVKRNMKNVMKKLLNFKSYKPDINKALYDAALVGSIDVIGYLIEEKGVPIDSKIEQENGDTALHAAVKNNHLNAVKKLLKSARNKAEKIISKPNNDDVSPLHLAAQHNKYKEKSIFEILIEVIPNGEKDKYLEDKLRISYKNDDPYLNPSHFGPLYAAVESSNKEMVEYIWELQKNKLPLQKTIIEQDVAYTPLHIASMRGDYEIVDFLVTEGFFIENIDSYKRHGKCSIKMKCNELH